MTSVLSKVFERLVSTLDDLWKAVVCFQPPSSYRKGLGTCDALLCVRHTLQGALDGGQEARICVVYIGTVFITPITARYGGWLSE